MQYVAPVNLMSEESSGVPMFVDFPVLPYPINLLRRPTGKTSSSRPSGEPDINADVLNGQNVTEEYGIDDALEREFVPYALDFIAAQPPWTLPSVGDVKTLYKRLFRNGKFSVDIESACPYVSVPTCWVV